MEKTLRVLNELQETGMIEKYAIGGAVAASFYMEPVATYDLDIFVVLPEKKTLLTSLSPIYEYLRGRGYQEQEAHIIIEGIAVQFIPVYSALVEEAVVHARATDYGEVKTQVLRPEYLVAIMLQTNRPKDRSRLTTFVEEAKIHEEDLEGILKHHGLIRKWREFRRHFRAN